MNKLEETSENIIHFRVRTFISLIIGLVVGTNVVNTILHNIAENTNRIEYNNEAEERRRTHLEERINYKTIIAEQKHTIEILKEKLEEANKE